MPLFSSKQNRVFETNTKFSILIPFRNEENNLPNILSDLEAQRYPSSSFELILIDDESTDNSNLIVEKLIANNTIRCSIINSKGGKKKAVQAGLNKAKGDFIISLDADVRIEPNHLQTFSNYYQQTKAKLIAGPISFIGNSSLFNKLLELEFTSLITSAAASIRLGKPIMLNAANMGFERAIALEFQKEIYQSNLASGDDQFLMEAIEKNYGGNSIHFLKSIQANAQTNAPKKLSVFINQRLRWASKTTSYSSRFSQFVAFLVFLFNLLFIVSFLYSITNLNFISFIILYLVKLLIDFPILMSGTIFFKKQKLMLLYPLIQLLYPWYIVIIAVLSIFGGYKWKGRNLR
jgi:glycosyltransferase involved in cell wall biosynthesis